MKKVTLILLLLASACQKKQDNNSQTQETKKTEAGAETSIGATAKEKTAREKTEKERTEKTEKTENKEVLQELREATWYEGRIKDFDIWLYINKGIFALYGYNSSKGEGIELINKDTKNKKIFKFKTIMTKNEEFFDGKVDDDGTIRGKWKSGNKTFDFELKPVNFENPRNEREFLEAFANLKLPFASGNEVQAGNRLFKDYYQEKKIRRGINNLTKFIPYEYFNILENEAILWGKVKVGENYLAIFQTDLIGESYEEKTQIQHGSYLLNNKDMFFAVLLDKEGNVLDARILGNDAQEAYYLNFSFEINRSKEIVITWTEFMRDEDGARVEVGEDKEIIKIKDNQFK